ncbi:hypothetical protein BC829DRAFT_437068 [Chytridium lagenaria]|nr:hypothetical protein BC829DRAFT_437068 [Chytridium lagenaria]
MTGMAMDDYDLQHHHHHHHHQQQQQQQQPQHQQGQEPLSRPQANSSRLQAQRMRDIAESDFDVDAEVEGFAQRHPLDFVKLKSRAASKTVNVKSNESLFTNLVPLHQHQQSSSSSSPSPLQETTHSLITNSKLPTRAKKAISKSWLEFKEKKPHYDESAWLDELEVDTISLRYPQSLTVHLRVSLTPTCLTIIGPPSLQHHSSPILKTFTRGAHFARPSPGMRCIN